MFNPTRDRDGLLRTADVEPTNRRSPMMRRRLLAFPYSAANAGRDMPINRAVLVHSRQAGFTLIELLVVLVILGLLAALAGPRVISYMGGARTDTARLQLKNFKSVLDLYRLDTGVYPSTQQGLAALLKNPGNAPGWMGPYIDSPIVPMDPWENAYVYRSPGEHGEYDLYTFGSDKAPSGSGEATDVTSWDN